jgi:hypothetical protein
VLVTNAISGVDILSDAHYFSLYVLDHTPKTEDDQRRLGAIGAFLSRSQTTYFYPDPSSNN